MAKKSATKKTDGGAKSGAPLVTIRAGDSTPFEIPQDKGDVLVRLARRWGYILRVRTRWAGDADIREEFGEKAVTEFGELGITEENMRQLALFSHIEIELHDDNLADKAAAALLEAASEVPWEYLLSAATRSVGRLQSLLITRCLSNGTDLQPGPPKRMLFVESAPGRIDNVYEFSDEETRIEAAVDLEEVDLKARKGLTYSRTEPYLKVEEAIQSEQWEVIHVTGIDTHQAVWMVDEFYDRLKPESRDKVIDKDDHLHDGMILRGDQESELPVRYDTLAGLLAKPDKAPHLVTLNLYYSGARTARQVVRNGAYAALGFLDEIDDEFAELFFQAFYWAWCHDKASIPEAFLYAWSQMDSDRMHGTSIVIWLGRSMAGESIASLKKIRRRKSTTPKK